MLTIVAFALLYHHPLAAHTTVLSHRYNLEATPSKKNDMEVKLIDG